MNTKINLRKLLLLVLYCGFAALILLILNNLSELGYDEWLKTVNLLILLVFIIQIGLIKLLKNDIFSISGIFLIFSYLFHLSYPFLFFINYDLGAMSYADPTVRYGTDIFRTAVSYSLASIIMLFLGMIMVIEKSHNIDFIDAKKNDFNKKLGILSIIVALPIDIYLLITRLLSMVTMGYTGDVADSSLLLFISYLLLPGVFLYISSIQDTRKVRIIAIGYIIYKLIGTFTGLRAYTILQIILFLYLYLKSIEKFKLKTAIYGIITGYFMLSWLIVIRNTRETGITLTSLLEIFDINNNVILNSLTEFGITINVVCITFAYQVEHVFGGQVMYSLLAIVPKVTQIFSQLDDNNIYNALDLFKYGGSYIADFYFDFGYWGLIACLIYGLIIQKISNFVNKSLKSGNYYGVAIWLPVVVDIIFSVRSGTYKLPRVFIWTIIMMAILKGYLKLMQRKN
jgi:hypothetical protein